MKMLRIVAAGALSYFAYRAWKRNRDGQADGPEAPVALRDDGTHTAPHGDPLLAADAFDDTPEPRPAAHSSPGFGAP